MTNKPIDPEYLSIDVPAEAYDAAELVTPVINEGEKEDQDGVWLDVRDDIGDRNKDLAGWISLPLELLKSKYHITRK